MPYPHRVDRSRISNPSVQTLIMQRLARAMAGGSGLGQALRQVRVALGDRPLLPQALSHVAVWVRYPLFPLCSIDPNGFGMQDQSEFLIVNNTFLQCSPQSLGDYPVTQRYEREVVSCRYLCRSSGGIWCPCAKESSVLAAADCLSSSLLGRPNRKPA